MDRSRNFRDVRAGLGNATIPAHERLFRSGHLARLDDASRAVVSQYRWGLVVDLRYPDERQRNPSPWAGRDEPKQLLLERGNSREAPHFAMFLAMRHDSQALDAAYISFYRQLPFDPDFGALFAGAVRQIAAATNPVLIHCSAGKDRTGVFVALLLDLLGVSRRAIMRDYLQSNDSITPAYILRIRDQLREDTGDLYGDTEVRRMLGVAPAFLDATFEAVQRRCGTVRNYFLSEGLDEDEIQAFTARMARREE